MSPQVRVPRLRAILFIGAALAFAVPAIALAHAEVVTATPAAGSTVTEPVSEVVVTYSEDLTDDSRLGVLDENGVRIAVGRVDPADSRRMVATFDQPLVAGTFTVRSTAIATDGHIEKTQWTFTVAVPATATPAGESSAPAPSASPTAEPTPSTSAAPTPATSPAPGPSSGSGSDVILPIIAGLAIITIGAGYLLSRGRRRPSA